MPLTCPACNGKSLEIVLAVRVEPDDDSDEASAKILRCTACNVGALGLYEESRRGRMGGESWRHWGWIVDEQVITAATQRLQATPRPTAEQFRELARGGKSFDLP